MPVEVRRTDAKAFFGTHCARHRRTLLDIGYSSMSACVGWGVGVCFMALPGDLA